MNCVKKVIKKQFFGYLKIIIELERFMREEGLALTEICKPLKMA